MPQLGETVTEGTVAQWLKQPGDSVEKYEAFVEVSTDKVNAEVPSPVSGVIRELIVKEARRCPPERRSRSSTTWLRTCRRHRPQRLALRASRRAAQRPSTSSGQATNAEANRQADDEPVPAETSGSEPELRGPTTTNGAAGNGSSSGTAPGGVRTSPAVRRLAREHHVDLAAVRVRATTPDHRQRHSRRGEGRSERGRRRDDRCRQRRVHRAGLNRRRAAGDRTQTAGDRAQAAGETDVRQRASRRRDPLTQARRIIAQRMSIPSIPHRMPGR